MSTRGVFIIRKDGADKAMDICHDAYPDGAGADIIDLVKTTDLQALYGCLTEYDEWDLLEEEEKCPDEPEPFSYDSCRLAVKKQKRIWISPGTANKIQDSLFCEYAYVADLDEEKLLFFPGGQTQPQKGNPYGMVPRKVLGVTDNYYPCRLAAVFPFSYIQEASTEHVTAQMKREEDRPDGIPDIRYFAVDDLMPDEKIPADYSAEMEKLITMLMLLENQMKGVCSQMQELHPVCINRVRDLGRDMIRLRDAMAVLEGRVEINR